MLLMAHTSSLQRSQMLHLFLDIIGIDVIIMFQYKGSLILIFLGMWLYLHLVGPMIHATQNLTTTNTCPRGAGEY